MSDTLLRETRAYLEAMAGDACLLLITDCNEALDVCGASPLTIEQVECLCDYEREEEAYAMIDDLEGRVGMSAYCAEAMRNYLATRPDTNRGERE